MSLNLNLQAIQADVHKAQMAALQASANYRNLLVVVAGLLAAAALLCPAVTSLLDPDVISLRRIAADSSASPSASASASGSASASASESGSASESASPAVPQPLPSHPTTGATATTSTSGAGLTVEHRRDLRGLVISVEFWGAVGGLVGLLAALWKLRSSSGPFGLEIALLVVKIPAGAWSALVGVTLVQAGLIPSLQLTDDRTIAAYAIVFGAGQQVITGLVDRRAGDLVDKAKSANENALT